MALSPAMLFCSNSALSHVSDVCFVLLGLWMLLLWLSHGHWLFALASGLALGFVASIRNSEVLLSVLFVWALWQRSPVPRRLANVLTRASRLATVAFASAYLVAALPNLVLQHIAFGSPFTTGYHYSGESVLCPRAANSSAAFAFHDQREWLWTTAPVPVGDLVPRLDGSAARSIITGSESGRTKGRHVPHDLDSADTPALQCLLLDFALSRIVQGFGC